MKIEPKRIEFQTITVPVRTHGGFSLSGIEARLFEMGKGGWTLTAVTPLVSEGTTQQLAFFFQRQVSLAS